MAHRSLAYASVRRVTTTQWTDWGQRPRLAAEAEVEVRQRVGEKATGRRAGARRPVITHRQIM